MKISLSNKVKRNMKIAVAKLKEAGEALPDHAADNRTEVCGLLSMAIEQLKFAREHLLEDLKRRPSL